ncbi:hypothetical protein GCM10023210_13980 [Chryseobacterium ginsengisoli]|uniref:Uncharacterized protein n=1 Tax=Chryseobacterium ginsengisoli TaxID=363853 RepID=A0ABP9M4Z4_9FLAO
MKLSDTATDYIIINAKTNSEWDDCDFAIIQVNQNWKSLLQDRMNIMLSFEKDYSLFSMDYADNSAEFYKDDNEIMPDSATFRDEKQWSFLSISQTELDALSSPENSLTSHELIVKAGGYAVYRSYGKHTGEEFWTAEFSIDEVIQKMQDLELNDTITN